MANEQVEIHDPFTNHNHNHLERSEDDDTEGMNDTVEFRLLMAYAKRRRGNKESPGKNGNRTPSPQTPPAETEKTDDEKTTMTTKKKKKRRRKRGWKRLPSILRCIKPQTQEEEEEEEEETEPKSSPPRDKYLRCAGFTSEIEEKEEEEEEELDDAAKCLTKIADQIPFMPPDLETDSPNDDVERLIGLLLRETGDRLNEKELKDLSLAKELFWNYAFFKQIITTLLTRMGIRSSDPDSPGPHASPKTQIAVTCEATSRLSAMDTQPMNRLLGYGSRYLKEYYSSWAQEHGGYDAAFESDEEDDDVQ